MAEESKTKASSHLARKEIEYEFFKQITGMIIAAFGLVAALAWNEAVKGLIDRYVSADAGLRSKFYYAFIVTILAVVITYFLGRMGEKFIRSKNQDKQD